MPVQPTAGRLKRILVLVPWVVAHPEEATVEQVCERFGLSPQELSEDLELLFMCGLPPFGPGDLIEAYVEGDRVVIRMADYLARPPRLTRSEAIMLLVMGRAAAELPGMEETDVLRSALGKLERAVTPGEAERTAEVAERIEIELDAAGAELVATLRAAAADRRRVRLVYYSAGRDEMTERDVDPLLVFGARGEWYLAAHDHHSEEERVFRLDRMRSAEPTGDPFEPPEGFDASRYADGAVFTPSARDVEATVDLAPAAAWVREVVPHDDAQPADDGWTRLRLRTPNLPWLARLLLQLGPHARPVAPAELETHVRDAARRALARYER